MNDGTEHLERTKKVGLKLRIKASKLRPFTWYKFVVKKITRGRFPTEEIVGEIRIKVSEKLFATIFRSKWQNGLENLCFFNI